MSLSAESTHTDKDYIFTVACPASSGLLAAITTFLSEHDCYISEMAQYDDEDIGQFFLRARFRFNSPQHAAIDKMRGEFEPIAERFDMRWKILDAQEPMKVLIMVSKSDHCLSDLLYHHRKKELNMEITAVVSNHLDLRPMVEREGIRFVYQPITPETKSQQEAALLDIIRETNTELVVLARYMQILSDNLCQHLAGRAINIHHSFLPGFKGARPYHQAFARGVKVIGATAHYVTADLDEGPIIEQEVQRVDHTHKPSDLVVVGRSTETLALRRAVKYHIEHRVFLSHSKTVIFQ